MVIKLNINPELTGFSVAYKPSQGFVGKAIFPPVPVDKDSGEYFKFDTECESARLTDDILGLTAEAKTVEWANSTDKYLTQDRGLQHLVPNKSENQATFPLKRQGTQIVLDKMALAHENRVKNKIVAAVAASSRTGNASKKWTDSTANIPKDIETVKGRLGRKANTLIIPVLVFNAMKFHPSLTDLIKYTGKPIVTADLLASLFDVGNVLIADVEINSETKNKSKTSTLEQLWPDSIFALYVEKSPGELIESAGYTFSLKLTGGSNIISVSEWNDPTKGSKGATYVKVVCSTDEKVVSDRCIAAMEDLL